MSHSSKRLMILGAGPFQVPAVKKAVELGCHVITVDYIPGNIGHEYSHESINCSTTDRRGVLEHARRLEVDGIMTMASDVAVPTVAEVASQLGLTAPGIQVADVLTDKSRFREFQVRHHLAHPRCEAADSPDRINWSRFLDPGIVMIKPTDTSGSRGISRVEASDPRERERAFEEAREFSRSGRVCVEEYVDGLDVTGEGFLLADKDPIMVFTQKFTQGCAVTGHRLPGLLSKRQERLATEAILAACNMAGYREGPLDTDLRVTDDRAVILEMSPRLGGNGCPSLLAAYIGVDPIELTIKLALGERFSCPRPAAPKGGYGSIVIGSQCAGILEELRTMEQVQQVLPYVREGAWAVRPGDRIERFRHGGDILGVAIFAADSLDDYTERAQRIREEADIRVVPAT